MRTLRKLRQAPLRFSPCNVVFIFAPDSPNAPLAAYRKDLRARPLRKEDEQEDIYA